MDHYKKKINRNGRRDSQRGVILLCGFSRFFESSRKIIKNLTIYVVTLIYKKMYL